MDLNVESMQPSLLVKMQHEKAGNTSRTKYFIRIGDRPSIPEINEPINLPDGGFIVPLPVNRGSSDFIQPHVPSLGDIRRMFGNDRIDCEPEYTASSDPDWSRVRPTTPAELENKINSWNEATSSIFRKYRAIEEKRQKLGKNIKSSQLIERPRSEGIKKRKVRQAGKRYNSQETLILGNIEKKTSLKIQETRNNLIVTRVNMSCEEECHQYSTDSSKNIVMDEMGFKEKQGNRITFVPSKINFKSYNTAINVVQKMSSDHWLIIDTLYNDIQREKGIDFEHLNKWINKIVHDIFSNDCEFILSTIHPDPVQRIVKLGKLMLNVYHEAMFGPKTKTKQKLIVPGIHNQRFSQKCLQVYTTFSPSKIRSTRMTSQMYENLTRKVRIPRCSACFLKNKEKETHLAEEAKKNKRKTKQAMKNKPNNKQKLAAKTKTKTKDMVKLNRKNSANLKRNVTKIEDDKSMCSSNDNNTSSVFGHSMDVVTAADETLKEVSESFFEDCADTEGTESFKTELSKKELAKKVSLLSILPRYLSNVALEVTEVLDTDVSNSINTGGGDNSLLRFSNDYNFFLSTLYERGSSASLEFSENHSSSPILADLKSSSKEREKDSFFLSSANILQLNNKLEKMMFKQASDETAKSVNELYLDTDTETFQDCEDLILAEPDEHSSKFQVQKKYYKYSRWMRLTDDCVSHKGCISFFMTIMLGLTTAFFCRGSFINQIKSNPTLKHNVKQVLKTFLLGKKYNLYLTIITFNQ